MRAARVSKLGNLSIYKANKIGKLILQTRNLKFDIGSWKPEPHSLNGMPRIGTESSKFNIDIDNSVDCDGGPVEIHYNAGNIILPNSGETLEINGKIRMSILCGQLLDEDMSLQSISECQERCNLLAERLHIFSKYSKYFDKFQDIGIPVLCATSGAGLKLKDMDAYAVLIFALFVLDDIFDNIKDFREGGLSILEISSVVEIFSSIVLGETTSFKLIQDNPNFPKFIPVCKLLFHLRQKVLELKAPLSESLIFFTSFVKYMESSAWELKGWTDGSFKDFGARKHFYFYHTELTSAVMPCVDLVCILKKIRLSEKIRRDPLFETLHRQIARQVALVNDILSLRKEISNEETSNIILIRNRFKPAGDSFAKTVDDLEGCMRSIDRIQDQLTKKFPRDPDLEEYFVVGKTWMDANVRWTFLNRRYGDYDFEATITL